MIIDTLIYVMVVLIDTTATENQFDKAFQKADRKFRIEMLRQASREASESASRKTKKIEKTKVLKIYRKEDYE